MKKEDKIYRAIGQAVCNVVGALMFVGVPITACMLVGYIVNLI